MARAKGNDAEPPAPRSSRKAKRSARNAIWNHALIAIITATIGVVVTVGLVWWQLVVNANQSALQQQMQLLNQAYVGYFNGRIQEIRTQAEALARAPATINALLTNDRAVMAEQSRRLTEQHGYARRVEIIPKGAAEKDDRGSVPIGYAALSLIQRAESAPFVGPEISRAQEHLVFAAHPIEHDGVVRGVLFLALDKKTLLFDPLTKMGNTANFGRVKIIQTIPGSEPTEVFTFGAPGSPEAALESPLAIPHWKLVFEPNFEALSPDSQVATLLTVTAVLLGFFLAGIAFAFSALSRKIQSDSEALSNYLRQIMRGRKPDVETFELPMFRQLAVEAAQLAGQRPSGGSNRRAAPRVSSPARTAAASEPEPAPKEADATTPEDLLADEDDGTYLEVNVADDARENFGIEVTEDVSPLDMGLKLDDEIFRAYDIRGVTTRNLTGEVVYWIGRAFAAEARDAGQERAAVGRDGRHSSKPLRDELVRGLTEGGLDVIDIGEVPTPVLYFATHALDTGTGVMITGSHNPPEYNGLKMMIGGETLAEERIQALKRRLQENRLSEGDGDVEEMDLSDHYVDRVLESVAVAQPCKVVVDCGNGVAGHLAPRLLEELGCEVIPLYCNVDGDFPNHHPDPADPDTLRDLIDVVKDEKADLGLAFDGDGDRLGVVTGSGEIIWPDKLLMLFAQDIVARNPGADIIYDVKCSRHLNTLISEYGGRPIMWRTGHSHMKAKLKETGALLAGEFSGHICFGERWYGFDDALYAAARLIEILGAEDRSADELFGQFPITYSTPEIKIETTEQRKFEVIEALKKTADWGDGTVTDIDGVRVDFSDGWGLIRASNTSPVLTLRFEADGPAALDRIQSRFRKALADIDPSLTFG